MVPPKMGQERLHVYSALDSELQLHPGECTGVELGGLWGSLAQCPLRLAKKLGQQWWPKEMPTHKVVVVSMLVQSREKEHEKEAGASLREE